MANKQTQRELAIVYRINQSTLSNLKKSGVDIYERDEVRTAMLAQRKRPPAWVNGCPWDNKPVTQPPEEGDLPSLDMESLERMTQVALLEGDMEKVKLIEGVTKISKSLQQMAVFKRDYIARDEVKEDLTRLGSATQAGHNKCGADLPAMLEGLEITAMEKIINNYMRKIGTELSDSSSELYPQITEWA